MATSTTNYGFRKPGATDVINVDSDLNNTYDFLDTKLKEVSDLQVDTAADLLHRSRIEISTANTLLVTDVRTTILQLNGGVALPVGDLQLEIWFAVRYAADPPTSLELEVVSSVARDWVAQFAPTTTAEEGTSDVEIGSTNIVLPALKVPSTAAGGTLYRARVASPAVSPSGTVEIKLETNASTDTSLLNFTCEWNVRDL